MGKNVKARLATLLEGCAEVTPERFALLMNVTQASATYLRKLLRETRTPLHPLVEGVRQDTPENLVLTLNRLSELYTEQPRETRAAVLDARDHAHFALRRAPRDLWRNKVTLHLNNWLENPGIYPIWVTLRPVPKSLPA